MLVVFALACGSTRAIAHDDTVDAIVGGLIILTLLPLYIGPTIVALVREHPDRWAILVANLLLGIAGIGWIACLI